MCRRHIDWTRAGARWTSDMNPCFCVPAIRSPEQSFSLSRSLLFRWKVRCHPRPPLRCPGPFRPVSLRDPRQSHWWERPAKNPRSLRSASSLSSAQFRERVRESAANMLPPTPSFPALDLGSGSWIVWWTVLSHRTTPASLLITFWLEPRPRKVGGMRCIHRVMYKHTALLSRESRDPAPDP